MTYLERSLSYKIEKLLRQCGFFYILFYMLWAVLLLSLSSYALSEKPNQQSFQAAEVYDILRGKEVHHNPDKSQTLAKPIETYFVYLRQGQTLYVGEYPGKSPIPLSKKEKLFFKIKDGYMLLTFPHSQRSLKLRFVQKKSLAGVFIGENVLIGGDKIRVTGAKSVTHIPDD